MARGRRRPERSPHGRSGALYALLLAVLAGAPIGASAQGGGAIARLERLDLGRIQLDGVTVVHSTHGSMGLEAEARRTGAFFADAVAFFEERLGGRPEVVVAVLAPRDFALVGMDRHPMPFSVPADRLVVVPARTSGFMLHGGRDTARAGQMLDVVRLHELSQAVAAAYLYPAGFAGGHPPVRWFDELVASYLAEAYMREVRPDLARFAQTLADEVIRSETPHFTSLESYERYHDGYMTTPQGAGTLGWFYNIFNRRAAALYSKHGLDFFRAVRTRLPWMRYELWTTGSLLDDLEEIAPGFHAWADDLAHRPPRR